MKLSPQGLEKLRQLEGLRLNSYQCSAGVWTIGYGSTRNVVPNMRITKQEAEDRLKRDVVHFEETVSENVQVRLNQEQFDALVLFSFNVGAAGFKKSKLLELLNNSDYNAVPAQLARWNKVSGKVNRGLINRRATEIALWNAGSDQEPTNEKPDKPKELTGSRTIAGGAIVLASETAQQVTQTLAPTIEHSEALKIAFVIATLVGVALIIYARIDDHMKGK